MPEITINSVEYTPIQNGKTIIHVFGRDATGESRRLDVTGFQPYFYASDKNGPFRSIKGESVKKVTVDRPAEVRIAREKYNHHEADVVFTTRFLIDTGLKAGVVCPSYKCTVLDLSPSTIDVPARVCMVDIECDDSNGWPDSSKSPIICLTCHDSFEDAYTSFVWGKKEKLIGSLTNSTPLPNGCFSPGKHTICVYQTESQMIRAFMNYVKDRDPDIMTGWNFTGFDMPYIMGRLESLRIPTDAMGRIPGKTERLAVRGRQLFDLLAGYKKMHLSEKESFRLDAIAKDELGEQKVRYTGKISDMWRDDPAKLIEYNFKDVELCVRIDRKDETISFFREVARYVGCGLDKTLNSSSLIDVYLLRKAHGKYVLPSKTHAEKQEYEGALVFDPAKGVKENVAVLDLKSLYPMITMTLNASPETKDPNGELRAPNGVRFKKEPDGLARSILGELLKERDAKKALRNTFEFGSRDYKVTDMQQNVIKVLMNSYYGVSGFTGFRLYDGDIASAITSVGRKITEHGRKIIEDAGYRVVYGDTDASFVEFGSGCLKGDVIFKARELEKLLNASYPHFAKTVLNANSHYFSIKFEKLYERFFQGGKKKRYAGLLVWKEGKDVREIDVTGFEIKRSDSPYVTKLAQKTLVEMVLYGEPYEKIQRELSQIIGNYRKGVYSLEEIGIPGGIGKAFDEYDHPDAQVRGAIYANENLGLNFGKGSKPKRLYIKSVPSGYPRTDVVCFEYADQIPKGFSVDTDVMLAKTLQSPITRLLDALGWNWNEFDPATPTLAKWGMG